MRQLLCVLCLVSFVATADDGPFVFEFEEVGKDVWVGVRPDGPRFPVMGNTTFVISDEGVVVFDGGGMPAMSEQVIDKIRSLTDAPVTHVVTSHWHGDHNFGVFRFGEEYPNVEFIAHEFTRDVMNSSRINYIDREQGFMEANREEFEKIIETGVDSEGNEHSVTDREIYKRILEDSEIIESEFLRAHVTPPNVVFNDKYIIESGKRRIELLYLGDANTAGDIVMWLPKEKIVATGDIVVLPSPYAFNMPPRKWAATLRAINDLDYKKLVPGHGPVQENADYVDLLVEVAESIADQRDAMLADGKSTEEVEAALDFSAYEERFTQGDDYIKVHYDAWFEGPFRAAAMKEVTGEPMVQVPPPEEVPFDDERWSIEAAEAEILTHLDRDALKLRGGTATLPDIELQNGILEFDIAVSAERGFAGAMFRAQGDGNFEHFYIRPHQSGNPDANQYTPVFNGVSGWQLYHGSDYAVPVEYRFDEWMPVKIVFAGSEADVYIDSDEPVLHISDLKHGNVGGVIGLQAANFSPAYFSNFRFTPLAKAYRFPSAGTGPEDYGDGLVQSWEVSDAFDAASLQGVTQLDEELMSDREWTVLKAEATGITNLARVQGLGEDENTVFARMTLSVGEPQMRRLTFGYSDAASVYVNGTLVYSGSNMYQSRDYRYLGTIGLFDEVMLPLEVGDNEVCIAVSEAFGGWGVMAEVSDFRE